MCWENIPSAGVAASANETEWNRTIAAIDSLLICGPADLYEVQRDLLRIISEDPTVTKLIGALSRARTAVS